MRDFIFFYRLYYIFVKVYRKSLIEVIEDNYEKIFQEKNGLGY